MQHYTCYRIPHYVAKWTCLLWYNWNTTFLLTTRCGKATHLELGQTNSMVHCEQGHILFHLETTNRSDKVWYQNKKQLWYKRLGFILERCQTSRGSITWREKTGVSQEALAVILLSVYLEATSQPWGPSPHW